MANQVKTVHLDLAFLIMQSLNVTKSILIYNAFWKEIKWLWIQTRCLCRFSVVPTLCIWLFLKTVTAMKISTWIFVLLIWNLTLQEKDPMLYCAILTLELHLISSFTDTNSSSSEKSSSQACNKCCQFGHVVNLKV